jgi:hypothetical protein
MARSPRPPAATRARSPTLAQAIRPPARPVPDAATVGLQATLARRTELVALLAGERGKAFKVAMVACMRKLLVILNAMVKHQRPWQPPELPLMRAGSSHPRTLELPV